jgi:hypothetical protein
MASRAAAKPASSESPDEPRSLTAWSAEAHAPASSSSTTPNADMAEPGAAGAPAGPGDVNVDTVMAEDGSSSWCRGIRPRIARPPSWSPARSGRLERGPDHEEVHLRMEEQRQNLAAVATDRATGEITSGEAAHADRVRAAVPISSKVTARSPGPARSLTVAHSTPGDPDAFPTIIDPRVAPVSQTAARRAEDACPRASLVAATPE